MTGLIRSIEDIRKYFLANISFDENSLQSFLESAEQEDIIPLISQAEYDNLITALDNDNPTEEQETLIEKIQKALFYLAFMRYVPFGNFQLNNQGFQQIEDGNHKAIPKWMTTKLEQSCQKEGYQGIELFLKYLEENKATFTDWAASDAYTLLHDSFINDTSTFTKYVDSLKKSRLQFVRMRANMKMVEEFKILPALCDELFTEIKEQIKAGTLTEPNELLLVKIQPVVANYTYAESLVDQSLLIDSQGVNVYTNTSQQYNDLKDKAPDNYMSAKIKQHNDRGNAYLQVLQDYLYKNVDNYPLFKSSDCYKPDQSFTIENKEENQWFGII